MRGILAAGVFLSFLAADCLAHAESVYSDSQWGGYVAEGREDRSFQVKPGRYRIVAQVDKDATACFLKDPHGKLLTWGRTENKVCTLTWATKSEAVFTYIIAYDASKEDAITLFHDFTYTATLF